MQNNYFENRGVDEQFYKDFKLPPYFAEKLPANKEAAILDIGCGFGQYLEALKKNGYTNLRGIDVLDAPVNACKARGLDCEKIKSIQEFCATSSKKFDFIIMTHVLEHVEKEKIIETLRAIRENILAEDGGLFIAVPNAQSNTGCYWAYEDFTHTVLFTAGSLLYVLKEAGYQFAEILDPKGVEKFNIFVRIVKLFLLKLYVFNREFWNLVTSSSYHRPSPKVFSFEVKVFAKDRK